MNKSEILSYQPTPAETAYELEVPYRIPVIVGDVGRILRPGVKPSDFDNEFYTLVATSFKTDVLYLNSAVLTEPTAQIINGLLEGLNPAETIIILPGEGSKAVLEDNLVNDPVLDQFRKVFVPTRRIVANGKVMGVETEIPDELENRIQQNNLNNVLVIDDVIATGKTLKTLRQTIQDVSPKPLDFSAFAWFCRRPSDTAGFKTVRGVYTYWTQEGYPALNTISTWLKGDPKAEMVLAGFMKNVRYPYGFNKQLSILKNMTIYN